MTFMKSALLASAALVMMSGAALADTSADGSASASVAQVIAIEEDAANTGLQFGEIQPVNNAGVLTSSEEVFHVTGNDNIVYVPTVSDPVELSNGSGGTIELELSSVSANGGFIVDNKDTITVTGSIPAGAVSSATPSGDYTATYTVDVAYN